MFLIWFWLTSGPQKEREMAGHPVMELRYQPLIFDHHADREFSFSSFQLRFTEYREARIDFLVFLCELSQYVSQKLIFL